MNYLTSMMLVAGALATTCCKAQITVPAFNATESFSELAANPYCHPSSFVDGLAAARPEIAIGDLRFQVQALSSPISHIPLFLAAKGAGGNRERFVTDLIIWDSIPNGTGEINGILMFFDNRVNPKLGDIAQMGGTVTSVWTTEGFAFTLQSVQTVDGIKKVDTLGNGVISTLNGSRWMVFKDISGKPLVSMILGKAYTTTVTAPSITFLQEGALTDSAILSAITRMLAFIPNRYGYNAQ